MEEEIQHVAFLIDDVPVEFYGALQRENQRFLRGIDPLFWLYQAATHEQGLQDSENRQRAAVALRLAYGQGLEILFALLAALVQAPKFPLGWITHYRNAQLRSIVRKIHEEMPVRKP